MGTDCEDDAGGGMPPKDELIALRFEQGKTREDIAEHYRVSIATVRRWIKVLKVPRLMRKKQKKQGITAPPVKGVPDMPDLSYSRFERARIILEGRVIERTGHGYYLDGRPASVADLFVAAGV